MYRTLAFMAAILVLALGLSACGQVNTGASASQTQQAGQQFLNDRSATAAPVAGNVGQMPADAPVVGAIDRIEGNKLIVKDPFSGSSTTLQLGSDTKLK